MDPIAVPAPPRSAYNPNRRVSDLLLQQVRHFQHVEQKRKDLGIDPELARNVYTEGGAALYIAAVTRALRNLHSSAQASTLTVMRSPKPSEVRREGLSLAASGATPAGSTTKPASHGRGGKATAQKTKRTQKKST